jgi:hypothetical protein
MGRALPIRQMSTPSSTRKSKKERQMGINDRMVDPEKNPLVSEEMKKVLVEEKRREQNETLAVLDVLRRTRKARGGVGAPLKVPAHLGGTDDGLIVLTDPDSIEELVENEREEASKGDKPIDLKD